MAKMHPPRFPYPQEPERKAEQQFYRACETQLDDEWTVLYEQHWHGWRNGRNQMGEADFLMLHVKFGAIVVELKGGQEIGVENGQWFTVRHGDTTQVDIKNPFIQVEESKILLWDWLSKNVPNLQIRGELGHMVVFPGHRQVGDMSPQARRQFICDRQDMQELPQTMERISRYFKQDTRWTAQDIRAVVNKLMPTFRLVGSKRVGYDEFTDQLDQLTDFQLKAFAMLRNQSTLNIHGGAGTGKTVLAFHRAKELSVEGKSVLYLCHSSPLAEFLRGEASANSELETASLQIVSAERFVFPHTQPHRKERLDRESFLESCLSSAVHGLNMLDALIVDEAQSIAAWVVEGAQLLLKNDGFQYIFGDLNQSTIYPKKERNFDDAYEVDSATGIGRFLTPAFINESVLERFGADSPIVLNVNCRSSTQIADFAHRIVNTKTENLGSSFAEVEVVNCAIENLGIQVAKVVASWAHEYGLGAEDIRILVPSPKVHDESTFHREMFAGDLCATVASGVIIDWLNSGNEVFDFKQYQADFEEYQKFCEQNRPLAKDVQERWREFLIWSQHRNGHLIGDAQLNAEENIGSGADDVDGTQSWGFDHEALRNLTSRKNSLSELALPQFGCLAYDQFIGLEAQAIVAILPMGPPSNISEGTWGRDRWSFITQAYTMSTRARALLAVVGDSESISTLNKSNDDWGQGESL